MRGLLFNGCSTLVFLSLAAGVATGAAPALPTAPDDSKYPSVKGKLEEVVVTAQKRRERLQNVPISITALSANRLKTAVVTSSLELGTVTPGLVATQTGNSNVLFLRGVGTALSTPGDEGSVNVVVDGVVYVSLPAEIFNFNNISRIEVLRGPQGTLFGRNASGGVISITTRDPQATPSADVSVGYGNYNSLTTSLYATGGITRNLYGDIAVQYDNQSDGFGRNLYNNTPTGFSRDFSIRSKLLWEPDQYTTVKLSGDYETQGGDAGIPRRVLPGEIGINGSPGPGGFYDIDSNVQPELSLRALGAGLNIHRDFPWFQLTSITADRSTISGYNYDQDATAVSLVNAFFHDSEQQFSQELQIASPVGSKIKWILGGYYLDSSAKLDPLELEGIPYAPVGGTDSRFGEIDTKSEAGFAQVTVPVGWNTNVTGGLRYTNDAKTFNYHEVFGYAFVPAINASQSKTFDKLTYRVEVDHKINDAVLLYASISTGFKSGSFNIINPTNPPIQPEKLTSYEAGIKTELFNHSVRLNAAGFYYDYKNIQLSQIVQGTTFFLNAASGTDYGLDVDFDTATFHGFALFGGAEILHATYDMFPNAPYSFANPFTCQIEPTLCTRNANGNRFVHAPDVNFTLTPTYTYPSSVGNFVLSATYSHTSTYPWEADNRLQQRPVDLLNAQLSWTSPNQKYRVVVWGKNLNNEEYYLQASSSLGDSGAFAPPRTYGATLSVHF